MRDEVNAWLKENRYPIGLLVSKWELSMMSLVEAAESLYDEIRKENKSVKRIMIGHLLRQKANLIEKRADIQEVKDIKTAHETVKQLRQENSKLRGRIEYFKWIFLLALEITGFSALIWFLVVHPIRQLIWWGN